MNKDLIRILSTCKVIDLYNKDPFPVEHPEDPLVVVGLSNTGSWGERYKCDTFYYIEYTEHDKHTWGGWTIIDKENNGKDWWTMNWVNDNIKNPQYAYIVDNEYDGYILAKFLDSINGYLDIENIQKIISEKKLQLDKILDEICYYKDIINYINDK